MSVSILLVEDEILLRNAFSAIFKAEKYIVYEAANGEEALAFLHSHKEPLDIIVLDLLMPIMGGIEFMKNSKIKETFPNTKVLILSNSSDEKTLKSIHDAQAEHYILKSGVSPKELVTAVKELI